MPKALHVDIETYSSVDLKKSGVYKHVQSIDFEILLVAYAFDDEPVKVIDLANGEVLPLDFLNGMKSPEVEKHAHNALFERVCFERYGIKVPIEEWFCSAVKSSYCGLPLGLDKVSAALKLGDKAKLKTGKALIQVFCVPVKKPTKKSGFKSRYFREDFPEKWEAFKDYAAYDVIAEREINRILKPYVIPDFERKIYNLDQVINDRGVLVDIDMAKNVLDMYVGKHLENILLEMRQITGVENASSLPQLKKWLSGQYRFEIKGLAKGDIETLITLAEGEDSPIELSNVESVVRLLKLRQKAAKTSINKYKAMLAWACIDDRVYGLLQFYGARTGRWAGRGIQLHNLPRNYLDNIAFVRKMFAEGDYDLCITLYEKFSNTLSQLIRTAFIAPPGKVFAVADFSAIEARVIAWLANEIWRLEVFRTHGKIYEASAAMMFGVPIEDVTKGSGYREKGKVAELALGYQGALKALKAMGGEKMGLSDLEMEDIVKKWRAKSPAIVALWKNVESAAIGAIKSGKKYSLQNYKNLGFEYDGTYLKIKLPSGRFLFYYKPVLYTKKFRNPETGDEWEKQVIKYLGTNDKGHWAYLDTYGGKLTENIVQAIARDLLANSMLNLEASDYYTVLHVHDEVVVEIDDLDIDEQAMAADWCNLDILGEICNIMGQDVAWAKGLPLGADGYITPFYKKD